MSRVNVIGLGFNGRGRVDDDGSGAGRTEFVMIQRRLARILAFTRRSIDDVVNDPIAKREVLGFYKLQRQLERSIETRELEQQWNSVA
jgi:hypothetical protein